MQGAASKGGPVGQCLCCGIWVYKFLFFWGGKPNRTRATLRGVSSILRFFVGRPRGAGGRCSLCFYLVGLVIGLSRLHTHSELLAGQRAR